MGKQGEMTAEERLEKMGKEEAESQKALTTKLQEEFKRKQVNMVERQKIYMEEELERRRRAGLEIGMRAQMQVMSAVMARMKEDMENDRVSLQKQHATGFGDGGGGPK